MAQKIKNSASKTTHEDSSKLLVQIDEALAQTIGIAKVKCISQKDDNKLLINFDYYDFKYM